MMREAGLNVDALVGSPVRVARVRADLTQSQLAARSRVDRFTVRALESAGSAGSPETFRRLERALGVPEGRLEAEHGRWYSRLDALSMLGHRQKALLRLPPADVERSFTSFQAWRRQVCSSAVDFGILTCLSTGTVTAYEQGRTLRFPVSLQSALMKRLRLSPEYVTALAVLPASDEMGEK